MSEISSNNKPAKMQKVELTSYDVVSVGRVAAGICGLFGVILAIIYFFIIVVLATLAGSSQGNAAIGLVAGIVGGLILGALFVGFYILFGFIFGVVAAALYNVIAKKVGPIKIEVKL